MSESTQPETVKLHVADNDGAGRSGTYTKKPTVSIVDPYGRQPIRDGPYKGYTVVKVEEKHGPLHKAIPVMPLPLAIIGCILNIVAPGVGTLLSSFMVFCCGPTRLSSKAQAFGLNLVSALLQMLTFLLIVGWIWSILWGMTFIQLALEARHKREKQRQRQACVQI